MHWWPTLWQPSRHAKCCMSRSLLSRFYYIRIYLHPIALCNIPFPRILASTQRPSHEGKHKRNMAQP